MTDSIGRALGEIEDLGGIALGHLQADDAQDRDEIDHGRRAATAIIRAIREIAAMAYYVRRDEADESRALRTERDRYREVLEGVAKSAGDGPIGDYIRRATRGEGLGDE